MKTLIAFGVAASVASAASAQVGNAIAADGINNFLTETITVDLPYDGNGMTTGWASGGDMFGITSRVAADGGLPFGMADDSAGVFLPDSQGIIKANDNGFFFGIVDSDNPDNPSGVGSASWTFDITGVTGLSVNLDIAAMGDFEATDANDFTWSIDGSAPAPLFTSSVDEAGNQDYMMEGGAIFNLNDPMLMNGVLLNNDFQTFAAAIADTGLMLTIAFNGGSNSGNEAFAFRNLNVIPTPGSVALIGLGGLAAVRRRRA